LEFSKFRSKKLIKKPINNAPIQFTKIVPKENYIEEMGLKIL